MLVLSSLRRVLAPSVLPLLLLAGCGRELTRSLAPEPESQSGALATAKNLPPSATILNPVPSVVFIPALTPPVTIEWTGQDADGHIREYRYRLFGRQNPDFPEITDYIAFLLTYPDSVLSHYGPNFEGWERSRVRRGSELASVTYPTLTANETYAFVVVAVDNRGAHDPVLSATRNVLLFGALPIVPDLTIVGPFGTVILPESSPTVVVPAGEPVTVSWFATPAPGMVIEGYRSAVDEYPTGDSSLDNTTATIPPPTSGETRFLNVEVQFDQGQRSLYLLMLSFTGGPLATSSGSRPMPPRPRARARSR